ncbi:MAG: hypothetical protein IPK26_16700 [Planctomycetes bacterium]|nr:hypothetical protein [Planctomycetota bacterium]
MGRDPEEFAAAAAPYVCVKITDLTTVDIRALRFDFDLTFAALLMHADGTIYHRYGSRGPDAADGYLSIASFARLLRNALPDHRAYDQAQQPPPPQEPLRAIDLPVLRDKRAGGQKIDCVHCHTVNDAEHVEAVRRKTWRRDDLWVFPDPRRVGIRLDPARQERVAEVLADSPAARAGLLVDDVLVALGTTGPIRSLADAAWALHHEPPTAHALPIRWRRDEREHEGELALPDGWKQCPPGEYAWRPYKWNLSPSSGFGGSPLDAAAKTRLGLGADDFAFTVTYLVDWGENAHRGRAAATAGLRKGDVLVAFAGRSRFQSIDEFHAWIALELTAGDDTELTILRAGERRTLRYRLPH